MDLIEIYIVYLGLSYSALAGVFLFYKRIKGSFTSRFSRLAYSFIGIFNGALAGLAMYVVTEDSYLFYCGAIIVLLYVFVFNVPLQAKNQLVK